jgi:hypothetical protein
MRADYGGRQIVGIDLHRRRSVIVRMTEAGEMLETVRIDYDPVALSLEIAKAGVDPEVVVEACTVPILDAGPVTSRFVDQVRLLAGTR